MSRWSHITFNEAVRLYLRRLPANSPRAQALQNHIRALGPNLPSEKHIYTCWEAMFDVVTTPLSPAAQLYFSGPPTLVELPNRFNFSNATTRLLSPPGVAALGVAESWFIRDNGVLKQAADNFRLERELLGIVWWELFDLLLTTRTGAPQAAAEGAFKRHILGGKTIAPPRRAILARLVPYHAFSARFMGKSGGGRETRFRSILRRARNRSPNNWKAVIPKQWNRRFLSTFPMWSIVGPPCGSDPFRFYSIGKKRVDPDHRFACRLGLQTSKSRGKKWLKLRYTLPDETPALFPTIADAYAGGFDAYQFRPHNGVSDYGLTQPLNHCAECAGRPQCGPLPECIHAPIKFKQLIAAPEATP